jgi:hypothetical protein
MQAGHPTLAPAHSGRGLSTERASALERSMIFMQGLASPFSTETAAPWLKKLAH